LQVHLHKTPLNLPAIQVQGLSGLEQQGLTASGITGVGQPTVGQGIASIQGAQQTAAVGSYFYTISKLF
jgi:hypothetical protein